jgi:scyllo-inositol 2-dehydrogenase (NADP+)
MNSRIIKTGLASFGMSGRIFHAPFIEHNPDYELTAILERTKNISSDSYPNSTVVRSFEDILNTDIELVIINTPSYLHYEMCKQALLAGKNVVVEKPFTSTVEEAEELIKLAETKELLITVYHNKRLEGDIQTIKKIIEEKQLGELEEITLQLRRFRPQLGPKKWKETNFPAAGLLYDIGAHFIDTFLYLFGTPRNIISDLQVQRKEGIVNDYFDITFEYDGYKARMISDMLTENKDYPTIEIKGSKGEFIKFGHDPQESKLASGKWDWSTIGKDNPANYGLTTISSIKQPVVTEEGNYALFYENLAKNIDTHENLLVSAQEGLEVIKLIKEIEKLSLINTK